MSINEIYTEFIKPAGDIIGVGVNFTLLVAALGGIFYFIVQFSPLFRLQRKVLGGIGAPRLYCLWSLASSFNRRKRLDTVRCFIEMAIVGSLGEHQDAKWWRNKWNDFRIKLRTFRDISEGGEKLELCLRVEDCSPLNSEHFLAIVALYFRSLKSNRLYYRINGGKDTPLEFLIPVRISDGYLAPMSFIAGLTKRFEGNWRKILSNYHSTLGTRTSGDPTREIRPEELFFSYNWLMWGPSYRVLLDDDSDRQRLVLFGYGDEANSVNVLIDGNDKAWELLKEHSDTFGMHGSITGRMVDTAGYAAKCFDRIDRESLPFFERISQPSNDIPFAMRLEDFHKHYVASRGEESEYFFTAYIWIMFELVGGNGNIFSPEHSATFFEHANLPNRLNYTFLIKCLMEKVFSHFDTIAALPESDPARGRRYRLCLSMNGDVSKAFDDELEARRRKKDLAGKWYRENFDNAPSPYPISAILNAFDNYFVEVKVREIDFSSESDRARLAEFYAGTYFPAFAHHANSQSLNHLLHKLRHRGKADGLSYHLVAAFDHEGAIAGIASLYYIHDALHGAVIEEVVIKENFKGIRRSLIAGAGNIFERECRRYGDAAPRFILTRAMAYCDEGERNRKAAAGAWKEAGFAPLEGDQNGLWMVFSRNGDHAPILEVAQGYEAHQARLCGRS